MPGHERGLKKRCRDIAKAKGKGAITPEEKKRGDSVT
jgi:hypothetical protein